MATFGADISDIGAIVGSVGASETGGGVLADEDFGWTDADGVGLSFISSGLADFSGPSAKLFFCFLLGKHMLGKINTNGLCGQCDALSKGLCDAFHMPLFL